MFHKVKWSFWLGLFLTVAGLLSMAYAWYYFHQTEEVSFVNSYIPPGQVIDVQKDITYRSIGLNDLPEGYLTKAELESQIWRSANGISVTDPVTDVKVTNKEMLVIKPEQQIVSYSFVNTGLLTFLIPGDKINIIDGATTIPNTLVLGKADKDGNLISLLPSLQGSARKQAEGLLASSNKPQVSSTSSLILLIDDKEAQILQRMSKPIITLQNSLYLNEPTQEGE